MYNAAAVATKQAARCRSEEYVCGIALRRRVARGAIKVEELVPDGSVQRRALVLHQNPAASLWRSWGYLPRDTQVLEKK
jgi:hypothetical protein